MNLNSAIIPKSDQLNFDSFTTGPRVIKITDVVVKEGAKEQPVTIHYEGENGRPYKPSKSMVRVFVKIWGSEGANYVGKRAMLYGDPSVIYGGEAVGGIKVSHLSHINEPVTLMLTERRGKRQPHTVNPLPDERDWKTEVTAAEAAGTLKDWAGKLTVEEKKDWWSTLTAEEKKAYKEKIV